MNIISNDQVEVIDINSLSIKKVNVNFYKRNQNRLIPTDEYWIKDTESPEMLVNLTRVAKARNFGKKKSTPKQK